ncbi:uncharacterized protein LOC143235409 isoform X2 [Tachypleus tridentatus]|uniref:uncharacterized protein LOC143235409 isoform X2 n=1 Tax=Tachypleus tridentatus TaxID=6853 RepID=UPI003FCFF917
MKMKKNTQREKVNKNILKNSSCNIQLKEGLKSSETSRDLHSSSSEVEVKKSSVSLPKCQFSSISLNSFKTSTPLSASGHLTQIRNGTSDNEKAYPCIPLGVFQHEIQMNQKDVGLMSTAKETQLRNEDLTHKKHTKVKASVILEPFFFGECKERGVGSTSERNDQRNNFHKISNKYSELSPNKVDLTKDPSNTALSGSCSDKVTHSEHVIVSSHDFCNKEVKSACATGKLNSSKDNSWEIMNSSYLHSKESTTARCSNKVTPLKDNSIYQPSTLEPQSLRKNLKVVSKSDEKPLSKDLSSMFNLYASPLKENITEETFFNFDSGNDTVSENSSRKMRDKETEKPLSFIQTSEKNNRSRRVETTTNSELSIAKSLYTTYTEDNGLGSSVSVKTQKYKSKNDVTPEKKAEERCGRISKKTVLQKTVSSFSDAPNGIKQRKHRAAAVKSTAKTKILFQTRVKELVEDNIPYDQPEDEEETAKGKINHCVSKKIQETNRSFNKQILKGKKSFISDTETSSEISWLGGKKRKVNVPKIKHTYEKKNVKAKTTMKIYSSTIIENSQNKEAKGNSHFGLEGRMYPPLKFSKAANMYNITSSLVEPEDLEVIWPSQKEQRKYSLGREMDRKSRKLINRKSSGTDWSDIENFEATEEPSSVSETKMKLSRSNSKIKNAQQKLTQLVSETFHNNAGINVSDIKSVNMVSNSDELSTKKDSTVLSNSLEETRRNLICGKETDIAHRKNKCKDLYGLAIEDLSGKMKQKARFVTEPESVNLGRENRESLNFNNKSAADLIVNKSKQKFNSICIQEEEYYKQHGIYNNTTLEKNCNVRHDASHIRYPNHSSSSNEPVSLASFKQSLSEELQKKSWILLQKLVLLEQLRSNPFKWRESLSDLDSPDIVPPNNSPETDFISSPVDRSERFNLNTTWANLEHKKYLMITKPGLYTPTQEVQSQRNAKLSEMDATVEPDDISYVPDSQKRKMARGSPGLEDDLNFCSPQSISSYLKDLKSSSPASFSLSFLKTMASPKYPSIQDQETYPLLQSFSPKNQKTLQSPKSSYFQNQKKEQIKDFDINIKGTKPSFSETDISPPKQRIGRATIHRVEEQICPSMLNFQSGRKQQAVDSPVINYCRTNFVFPDVKSEVVPRKLEEQVKALSKKYINTIQRCISTFNNQLAEYKEQVFEVIAEITDENHAAFQVNCDLLTYMKESKNHRLKLVHKFAKLEEKVQLLRLAENKLEEKLKEIQKKATLKYQQELQRVKEEFYTEMEKSVLKQLHHHLSTFNLFI